MLKNRKKKNKLKQKNRLSGLRVGPMYFNRPPQTGVYVLQSKFGNTRGERTKM